MIAKKRLIGIALGLLVSLILPGFASGAKAPTLVPAALTTPAPGSTLPGASVTFVWSTGTGVTQYWLGIRSMSGNTDICSSPAGTSTGATVVLPTDGRTLYVRLWSSLGGAWQYQDATYTAARV